MPYEVLTTGALHRRQLWIERIASTCGSFSSEIASLDVELTAEIERDGVSALLDHLRLCGSIPENYEHDSSAEKLYSKYTDALLAAAYRHIGLTSFVLAERGDSADVEAVGQRFSLVADAKAFRLSRTAKNQKDFKIDALHGWKRGKPHAMIICPIYQLPTRQSQIYSQAISRSVCIFSYSHLAVLVGFSEVAGKRRAQALLLSVLNCAEELNPTKDSVAYWTCINREMLGANRAIGPLWKREKIAIVESIAAAKEEALTMLAQERERIMRMSKSEAIRFLLQNRNLDGREKVIRSLADSGILTIS